MKLITSFLILTIIGSLNTCFAQTSSGDIELYLNDFIDNIPSSSGNHYTTPTNTDLINWENTIVDILSGDITNARTTATLFNYIVTEYTDTNNISGQVYYILEEAAPLSKYWGTYVFNSAPTRTELVIQTVHARNDTNTGDESVYSFARLSAKALLIQGTHRCNHSTTTSCSGTTSVCGSSGAYSISDLAHNVNTVFQKTTKVLAQDKTTIFLQLHGFSQGSGDPDIIMSNGSLLPPTGTDYVALMKDELLTVDSNLTFQIPHIDIGWTRLAGTTNTQGRLLNRSSSPCNTAATSATGRFIHMEQAFSLRSNSTGWNKIYLALANVFSCPVSDNTPPVINCDDITVQLDEFNAGSITSTFLNNLATENCSTSSVTASKTDFDNSDITFIPINDMVITGVIEGDINATNIKAIEVTVLQDIADLSLYGLGVANNGGGTDGEEFTFPAMSAVAGDKFLITNNTTTFNTFFGFAPDFVDSGLIFFNGDDAIELFFSGSVIDRYGEPNVDGTGEVWEYVNSWAYRATDTHPDGTIFAENNWIYSCLGANNRANSNAEAFPKFPIGEYQILPDSQPVRVEAMDSSGNISSCFVNVRVEPYNVLGINDDEIEKVIVYPNPASRHIQFSKNIDIKRVAIYSITGKEVLNTSVVDNKMSVSNLNEGLYLLKIVVANGHTIQNKIVIKR